MARRSLYKLTATQPITLSEPGRYSDGGCLWLVISKTGSRKWSFIYIRDGKKHEMGLGPAGVGGVPLALARAKADHARQLLYRDIDPLEERRRWSHERRVR